ncbi:hypothetical protein pb186bvf_008713 [Paramecium bursaria]
MIYLFTVIMISTIQGTNLSVCVIIIVIIHLPNKPENFYLQYNNENMRND